MAIHEEHELADYDTQKHDPTFKGDDNGEFEEEVHHASYYLSLKIHWGLPRLVELAIFYNLAVLGWISLIASAAVGSYKRTSSHAFIATITCAAFFHWAAWFQTAFAMWQRASWRREETLQERVQFLFFAIRLQRLMIPTAVICLAVFIQAYARREELKDLAYWLIYLLFFIFNTVSGVMNGYNNINWEADRLYFDDGVDGIPKLVYALLGI